MRIITLDYRVLSQETLSKIRNIPVFGDTISEHCDAFKSNIPFEIDHSLHLLEELCNRSSYEPPVVSPKVVQLSAVIAIYDATTDLYWVTKNRPTGRKGWHTVKEFGKVVEEELYRGNLEEAVNALLTRSTKK